MQRRSFLISLGSMAIASSLTGCSQQEKSILRVLALKNSLPPQLLGEFISSIRPISQNNGLLKDLIARLPEWLGGAKLDAPTPSVELATEAQLSEIFISLQEWVKTGGAEEKGLKFPLIPATRSPEYIPNLISMGDAWLSKAIRHKSIEPITTKNIPNWAKLAPQWQELARRDNLGNSSSTGQIWGVPYRWGTTVIVYRRDLLESAGVKIPTDWEDLWNPQLKQRISLLDRSREVIGLTLKKLGASYNQAEIEEVSNLKPELQKLHQQAKFYSADNYLQPLILGDTWVAVGWSSDIIDLIQNNPNIGAIIPRSGTAIWADLWVQPTRKRVNSPAQTKLVEQWIDYCLQLKTSNQISLLTPGTAPLLSSVESSKILSEIKNNQLILPARAILDKSEFIYPLTSVTQSKYDRLWQEIRKSKVILSTSTI